MKNYLVQKYSEKNFKTWNSFLETSKNGTFLFNRNFMEYHSDRFQDYSLMIYENEKLVALFPANYSENVVYSHQGLTYGGIIISDKCKLSDFLIIFDSVINHLKQQFCKLIIKIIPSIYNIYFSDEILYALFLKNAKLTRRDTLSVIDLNIPNKISSSRKQEIKKGIDHDIKITETTDFKLFWNDILIPNLNKKHNSNPVHTLSEIEYLHDKFPNQIKQYNAYYNGKIVAGTTVFITKNVVHIQYISSNELRGKTGALDFLFNYLIQLYKDQVKYFDFGTSNENQGRSLNEGLLFWKESFGAKTIVQDFYELELSE